MRLAVFSDLHLGPGASNRCTASAAQLHVLFDRLEQRAQRVLVAGDIYDLDRPKRPGDWQAVLNGVREEFPDICGRLQAYSKIFGNHDGQLCRLGVPEEREYRADGLRIVARHGHQWDMLLKKVPALASAANFVAGWLDRAGRDAAATALGGLPLVADRIWHTRSSSSPGPDRLLSGATDFLADHELDILICGHSHRLRLIEAAGGLFVNTGSLCRGHIDWVLIDTAKPWVCAFRNGECVQQAWRGQTGWHVEGGRPDDR